MRTDVILVGGFHEMVELCQDCDMNIVGIIDNELTGCYYGIPVIGKDRDAETLFPQYNGAKIIVTPDSPILRKKLATFYQEIGYEFATVVSPYARISPTASIGLGTIVQAGVNISSATEIGRFCKLNTNCNVMHDTIVGDFSTIAPNAVCLGRVSIGQYTYVGANSTILPEIKIGYSSTVGAGAVVTRNVADCITVKGVPAK